MRKLVAVMLFSCLPVMAFAAGGGNNKYIVDAPVNLQDKVSLQNGAKLFVNYCICLLYTSPSPRDKRQSRMPSSA